MEHGRWFDGRMKPPPGVPINPEGPAAGGLVTAYLFNEVNAQISNDLGPRSLSGLWQSRTLITWIGGETGPALRFSGASPSFIQTPAHAFLGPDPNRLTIEAMVRPRVLAAGTRYTIYGTNDQSGLPQLEVGDNGTASNSVTVIVPGVFVAQTVSNAIAAGQWAHLVYTRAGSGATHAISVNGRVQSLVTSTTDAYSDPTAARYIAQRGTNNQFFDGDIAWLRTWNRYMPSDERQALYAAPFAMLLPPRLTRSLSAPAAAFRPKAPRITAPALGPPPY